jgi:hypothetical protein
VCSSDLTCYARDAVNGDVAKEVPVGADGAFQLLGLRAGEWTCTAAADKYSPNSQTVFLRAVPGLQNKAIEISIARIETGIHGRVTSGAARLAGARVNCTQLAAFPFNHVGVDRVWAHQDGRYHFEPYAQPLAAGETSETWLCAAHMDGYVDAAMSVELPCDANVELDFDLVPEETSLTVNVVDKVALTVVTQEATVTCVSKVAGLADLGTIEAGSPGSDIGSAHFANIAAGVYECTVTSPEWEGNCVQAHVVPGRETRIDLLVKQRPGHIRGFTCELNADGSSGVKITRVEVTCVRDEERNPVMGVTRFRIGSLHEEREDLKGSFTVANLPPGEYTCIGRFPEAYRDSAPVTAVVNACEYTDIKLQLEPLPGTVVGLVYEPSGYSGPDPVPITGATVRCVSRPNDPDTEHQTTSYVIFGGQINNYRIEDVSAGSIDCTCEAEGYSPVTPAEKFLESGGQVKIDCPMIPFLGEISARIFDTDTGSEVCQGRTRCNGVEIDYVRTQPRVGQSEGPFVFSSQFTLRLGAYQCVGFSDPEYSQSATRDVDVFGTATVDVQLDVNPLPATIFGTVSDSGAFGGAVFAGPIEGATVSCQVTQTRVPNSPDTFTSGPTNALGEFSIPGIPRNFAARAPCPPTGGGLGNCVCSAPGYVSQTIGSVTTYRNSATRVDCELDPIPGALDVEVVSSLTGATIDHASVQCVNDFGFRQSSLQPWDYVDLRPARYTCTANAGGFQGSGPYTVMVVSGETAFLEIPLDPFPYELRGTCTDCNSGVALVDAVVECTSDTVTIPDQGVSAPNGAWGPITLFNFGDSVRCQCVLTDFNNVNGGDVFTDTVTLRTSRNAPLCLTPRASTISGTATDALTGTALADITVRFNVPGTADVEERITDENGQYIIGIDDVSLPFGVYVANDAQDLVPQYGVLDGPPQQANPDVSANEDHIVDFLHPPQPSTLTVRVVNPFAEFATIEGATITCRADVGTNNGGWSQSRTTDSDGEAVETFSVYDLPTTEPGCWSFVCDATGVASFEDTIGVASPCIARGVDEFLQIEMAPTTVVLTIRVWNSDFGTITPLEAGVRARVWEITGFDSDTGAPDIIFDGPTSNELPASRLADDRNGFGPLETNETGFISFRTIVPIKLAWDVPDARFVAVPIECPAKCIPKRAFSEDLTEDNWEEWSYPLRDGLDDNADWFLVQDNPVVVGNITDCATGLVLDSQGEDVEVTVYEPIEGQEDRNAGTATLDLDPFSPAYGMYSVVVGTVGTPVYLRATTQFFNAHQEDIGALAFSQRVRIDFCMNVRDRFDVSGTVRTSADNSGLADADVFARRPQRSDGVDTPTPDRESAVVSNEDGTYTLLDVLRGDIDICARKDDYHSSPDATAPVEHCVAVSISAASIEGIDFLLTPDTGSIHVELMRYKAPAQSGFRSAMTSKGLVIWDSPFGPGEQVDLDLNIDPSSLVRRNNLVFSGLPPSDTGDYFVSCNQNTLGGNLITNATRCTSLGVCGTNWLGANPDSFVDSPFDGNPTGDPENMGNTACEVCGCGDEHNIPVRLFELSVARCLWCDNDNCPAFAAVPGACADWPNCPAASSCHGCAINPSSGAASTQCGSPFANRDDWGGPPPCFETASC